MRRRDSGTGCGACGRGKERIPRTRAAPDSDRRLLKGWPLGASSRARMPGERGPVADKTPRWSAAGRAGLARPARAARCGTDGCATRRSISLARAVREGKYGRTRRPPNNTGGGALAYAGCLTSGLVKERTTRRIWRSSSVPPARGQAPAEDPVNTEIAVITGSPACAGDDSRK